LDPEISSAAAHYQASRVARLRHLPLPTVQALITQHQKPTLFDVFGEARVNVLELNLALDSLH
jgi:K+-transporting ATPase ATPase C chain